MQKIHFLVGDKSVPLSVEVKRSPESIRKGLMHRKEPLEKDTGALFDLGVDADHGFWMKNTFIPLDMIFVDNNMKVVGIVHNAKPLTTKSRRVGKNSRYVVEVNAGWAKKNGIVVGTKLSSHMSKTASEKYKQVPFKGGYVRVKIKDKQGNHLQHHFVRVNRWGLPAGGIEKGETPRQAAARELLERTGYKIDEAALRPAGRDSRGFYIFEGDKKNTRVVAKPGQLGGYSTKVKWGGPNETSHSAGQKKKSTEVARHTRKLKSGKRVEVKPHTRRKSGKLEERYPEIKFKRQTGRIREALKMKARRGYSTQNESLHIKYGPKVHFGVGRHGAHFGVYGKGPATHFYQDKVYVGNAKKGKTYTLSKEQRQRVAKLMQDRKKQSMSKTASWSRVARLLQKYISSIDPDRVKAFERKATDALAKDIPGTENIRMLSKDRSRAAAKFLVENPGAAAAFTLPGGSVLAPAIVGAKKALLNAAEKAQKKSAKN